MGQGQTKPEIEVPEKKGPMPCGVTGLPLLFTPCCLAIIFFIIIKRFFTEKQDILSYLLSEGPSRTTQFFVMGLYGLILVGIQLGLSAALFQWEAKREKRKIKNMKGLSAVFGFLCAIIILNLVGFFAMKFILPLLKALPLLGQIIAFLTDWVTDSYHTYFIMAWGWGLASILMLIPVLGWILAPILLVIPVTPLMSYLGYVVGCRTLEMED